jgi:hypothetical protein
MSQNLVYKSSSPGLEKYVEKSRWPTKSLIVEKVEAPDL